MSTISQKLTAIAEAKAGIKSAIINKGQTVGNDLTTYAAAIGNISGGGMSDVEKDAQSIFPPAVADYATLEYAAGRTDAVLYSANIGILDSNKKEWDLKAWNARFKANGYSTAGLTSPIGIWMKSGGRHFAFLWHYVGTHYDITGTTVCTDLMRHSQYEYDQINAAASGTDYTTGKGWSVVADGNEWVLTAGNTGKSWRMKKNCASVNAVLSDNFEDRTDAIIAQSEWLRHRFAVDSGLTTTEANGTIGVVTILNASGNQAAVGEDMYFYVNGVKSDLLAKYNLNNRHGVNSAYLTQTYADAIYDKQKAKGINMNDTGVNSATYPILTPGSKGAEAIAVGGKWYIITPYLSRIGATYTADYFIPDAPAIYYAKYRNAYLPSSRNLYNYWTRKAYITAILTYLRNREGGSMASVVSSVLWSVERSSVIYSWFVYSFNGNLSYSNVYSCYAVVPSIAL